MEQQSRALAPVEQFRNDIAKMSDQFKMVLPPSVSVDRFIRVAVTAIQGEPKLLNCARASLYDALMKCAKDGLIPDGREAAITPFGKNGGAQYMPMIAGVLKRIRGSGEVTMIDSDLVYEKDSFEYWRDDFGAHLKHRISLDDDREQGKFIGAFAQAQTKQEGHFIEWMSAAAIKAVANVSKAKGPWDGPFWGEMARKTVVRRLSKRLPMNTDAEEVVRRDDELYDMAPAMVPREIEAQSILDEPEPQEKIIEPTVKDEPKPEPKIMKAPRLKREEPKHDFQEPPWDEPTPKKSEPVAEAAPAPAATKPEPRKRPIEEIPFTKPAPPEPKDYRDLCLSALTPLGFTPTTAGAFVKEKMKLNFNQLTSAGFEELYKKHLVPLAADQGVEL